MPTGLVFIAGVVQVGAPSTLEVAVSPFVNPLSIAVRGGISPPRMVVMLFAVKVSGSLYHLRQPCVSPILKHGCTLDF